MQQAVPEEDPPADFDAELAANVSRAFWIENRSKIEIADEFEISRFKVARLLEDARRYGMVHIEITEPKERLTRLADQVRAAFGLTEVALSSRSATSATGLAALGAVAAAYLQEHVPAGSTIGLGWGRTLAEVVGHLAVGGPADVVQLAGGFAGSAGDFNGSSLVTEASVVLRGSAYVLHAPALVESSDARALLRADHTVARTVARYGELDALVTGVGVLSANPCSPIYRGEVLSPSVHRELRRWGVVGDACCHFIDARGHVVDELAERSTGISVEEIRSTPLRIAVAGGADKLVPLLAALRSGMPNVVITDVDTARMLLAADGAGSTH
ncbi:MAG TPA: sugar-binding domain-containing protein [Propionibacteriaceae bacterium]|jgi:DNA-binding transcriptional regulator LsrR (DeoR family)